MKYNQGFKDFLRIANCERCGKTLNARILSWFNEQTICLDYSAKEDALKKEMRAAGLNPSRYEGCGFIPKI